MAVKWESIFIKKNQKAARPGWEGMAVNWQSTYIYMLFQKAAEPGGGGGAGPVAGYIFEQKKRTAPRWSPIQVLSRPDDA